MSLNNRPDAIKDRVGRYLNTAVRGVHSAEVDDKIALHLGRFRDHFHTTHGHDRRSDPRDRSAWPRPRKPIRVSLGSQRVRRRSVVDLEASRYLKSSGLLADCSQRII